MWRPAAARERLLAFVLARRRLAPRRGVSAPQLPELLQLPQEEDPRHPEDLHLLPGGLRRAGSRGLRRRVPETQPDLHQVLELQLRNVQRQAHRGVELQAEPVLPLPAPQNTQTQRRQDVRRGPARHQTGRRALPRLLNQSSVLAAPGVAAALKPRWDLHRGGVQIAEVHRAAGGHRLSVRVREDRREPPPAAHRGDPVRGLQTQQTAGEETGAVHQRVEAQDLTVPNEEAGNTMPSGGNAMHIQELLFCNIPTVSCLNVTRKTLHSSL